MSVAIVRIRTKGGALGVLYHQANAQEPGSLLDDCPIVQAAHRGGMTLGNGRLEPYLSIAAALAAGAVYACPYCLASGDAPLS